MKQIIAIHGWSGDSQTWKDWIGPFQKHGWVWQSGERGYYLQQALEPQWRMNVEIKQKTPISRVVIAHSLGLHLLNQEILLEATAIVLLSSFGRFIPLGRDNRAIKTALNGMRKSLGTQKESKMLGNFHIKACHPSPTSMMSINPLLKDLTNSGRERLIKDLDLLIDTNGLPKGFPPNAKVLVINAEEDAIINPQTQELLIIELNRHLHHELTHWRIAKAGHTLLVPNLKNRILDWIESCL